MKENKRYMDDIERTLQSLDHIHRAEPAPFFFTRLEARMRSGEKPAGVWRVLSNPVLSVAVLLLLLVLNIGALTRYTKSRQVNKTETSGMQSLANELDHDITSVYNDKTNP